MVPLVATSQNNKKLTTWEMHLECARCIEHRQAHALARIIGNKNVTPMLFFAAENLDYDIDPECSRVITKFSQTHVWTNPDNLKTAPIGAQLRADIQVLLAISSDHCHEIDISNLPLPLPSPHCSPALCVGGPVACPQTSMDYPFPSICVCI